MSTSAPQLKDRTVVITGGFGVLGMAAMNAALDASARVALIDRGPAPDRLNPAILPIPDTDLAAFGAAQQAFDSIGNRFGGIDVLLNIAGAFEWCPVAESDTRLWLDLYSANVLTAVNACRAALPWLPAGSTIVNVAAATAQRGATAWRPTPPPSPACCG